MTLVLGGKTIEFVHPVKNCANDGTVLRFLAEKAVFSAGFRPMPAHAHDACAAKRLEIFNSGTTKKGMTTCKNRFAANNVLAI
jgi:hypothetical protein